MAGTMAGNPLMRFKTSVADAEIQGNLQKRPGSAVAIHRWNPE
jgi:hypothetical protein